MRDRELKENAMHIPLMRTEGPGQVGSAGQAVAAKTSSRPDKCPRWAACVPEATVCKPFILDKRSKIENSTFEGCVPKGSLLYATSQSSGILPPLFLWCSPALSREEKGLTNKHLFSPPTRKQRDFSQY